MNELRILSPSGIVGYGFPEESFLAGVALKPDLIACDGGSTDPGRIVTYGGSQGGALSIAASALSGRSKNATPRSPAIAA